MIPVTQTRTGKVDGNCFPACLASILEIPLESIPEFGGEDEWIENTAKFLESVGLYYVQVKPDDPMLRVMFSVGRAYHTVKGTSPRGGQHACVGLNGKIVFDPHPQDGTGRGLIEVSAFGLLCSREQGSQRARMHRALDRALSSVGK
jgi:hypothetical protein